MAVHPFLRGIPKTPTPGDGVFTRIVLAQLSSSGLTTLGAGVAIGFVESMSAVPAGCPKGMLLIGADGSLGQITDTSGTVRVVPTTAAALSISAFVATLLDDANAGAFLTTLGISAFAQTILDDADAATVRTTIGAQGLNALLTALVTPASEIADLTATAAGEASNHIDVSIQLKDSSGTNISRAQRIVCKLYDANMLAALVATRGLSEVGAGSEVSATGKPFLIVDTDANGVAVVRITDGSGVATGTMYLELIGVNLPAIPRIVAVTFA